MCQPSPIARVCSGSLRSSCFTRIVAELGREPLALLRVQVLVAEEDDAVLGPRLPDRLVRLVRVLPGQVKPADLRADQPARLVRLRQRRSLHASIIGRPPRRRNRCSAQRPRARTRAEPQTRAWGRPPCPWVHSRRHAQGNDFGSFAKNQNSLLLRTHIPHHHRGSHLARAAHHPAADGLGRRADGPGRRHPPERERAGARRARPVRPGDGDQTAVHRPDQAAAGARPHHDRPAGRADAAQRRAAEGRAHAQPAASVRLGAVLPVGDADRGRVRRCAADRGGRGSQAAEDLEDARPAASRSSAR